MDTGDRVERVGSIISALPSEFQYGRYPLIIASMVGNEEMNEIDVFILRTSHYLMALWCPDLVTSGSQHYFSHLRTSGSSFHHTSTMSNSNFLDVGQEYIRSVASGCMLTTSRKR